ncbi:hypothetical protein [Pseudoponticoccus marisrubri]|uniref:hypothetical protein n=1 Tax=Pseudoponticoccus marisrubri TaxID=1685382 RepID=UPI0012FDFEEB|nr:hypothetical protein [Pseudoponticoccus marisrubri]
MSSTMVSSSKILTVSYGTFSCTAEGFEDPLAVMKETTHFFRHVVNEDRFFGAEPPQFDAELASEMLRDRLAAEESDARLSFGVPGATAASSSGALAAALEAGPARPRAEEPARDLPDDDVLDAAAQAAALEEAAEAARQAQAEQEMATEVADAPAEAAEDDADMPDLPMAEAPVADENPVTPDAPEIDLSGLDLDAATPDTAETPEPLAGAAYAAPEPETGDEIEADTAMSAFDAAGDVPAPRPAAPSSSVADKLERIRAVVADNAAQPEPADPIAALSDSLSEEVAEPEEDTPVAETEADELDDTALDAMLAAFGRDEAPEMTPAEPVVDDLDEDMSGDEDNLFSDTIASLVAAETVLPGSEQGAEAPEPIAEAAPLAAPEHDPRSDEIDLGAASDAPELDEQPAATAEPAEIPSERPAPTPVRARVVKVKRAVFDKAVEEGRLEEVEDTPPPAPEPVAPRVPLATDSSLSPEEEDELARELAAVKAELAEDFDWDDDEDDTAEDDTAEEDAPFRLDNPVSAPRGEEDPVDALVEDTARKTVKMASPARAMLTEQSNVDDDTSRLIDKADTEMNEPEGNRRRSAIAHLRAAVAATKADRLLSRKTGEEDGTEAYREDLADVVRPRRPQSGAPRTERPVTEPARPAPLKLVAEQRVAGAPAEAAPQADLPRVTPVRPRRVRRATASELPTRDTPTPEPEADGEGFAAYAAEMGATQLPELLEAAAAYMSFVEGRDQFSRPQLMTTVRQAEQTESSREDRLRSFGQLLREGKIEKTSGGRFTASPRISFKPDKAAG